MKRIVVDAGPLIHLHEAGGLALLSKTGEVFAPQIIAAEAKSLPAIPEWLIIREPSPNSYNELQPWVAVGVLEGGEAASLALAVELQAEWFLTDDAEARLVATELGLETHGSLGVVLWAARERLVQREEATRLLDAIELGSLWISPRVRSEARRTLESIWRAHDGT
jgi:predicted nucleic acid-binding protein